MRCGEIDTVATYSALEQRPVSSFNDILEMNEVAEMTSIAMHEILWTPNELFTQYAVQKNLVLYNEEIL